MSVADLLREAAREHSAGPALRYGASVLSYEELDRRVSSFASALLAHGLERGDRVALLMRNCPEFAIGLFGAFRAGLVAVPVNAKLAAPEVAGILADCEARALLFDEGKTAIVEALGEARPELALCATGPAEGFTEFLASGDPLFAGAEVAPDDLAWLFYTSGTTGRSKGAQLSHRNLEAMIRAQLADVCQFKPQDRVLHAAPLSHGSGLYLLGAVARGVENIVYDGAGFDPSAVLELIERERVTVIAFLAPTMIAMLLDAPAGADTSSLRTVIYGGGPLSPELGRRMLERFGRVFVQMYGQGESPMTITYLAAGEHDPGDPAGLASAGVPQHGVEVAVMDEHDRPLPPGEQGEVCVRGEVVMSGYWRNPEATAAALRCGWLHTGDIGRFDERGRLFLLDRAHDMIISGGSNIYPREVEDALLTHPGVKEAAVFGVPDVIWGESVAAAVVTAGEPVSEEELVRHCRESLASYKKPKKVYFVDELPKSAYGKVLRRVIRDQLADRKLHAEQAT